MEDLNRTISKLKGIKTSIFELRRVFDRIGDEEIRQQLKAIIKAADEIYKAAVADPGKLEKLDRFDTYYLRTLKSILLKYETITGSEADTAKAGDFSAGLSAFLQKTEGGFNELYRSLFTDDEVNLDADMRIMEQELQRM